MGDTKVTRFFISNQSNADCNSFMAHRPIMLTKGMGSGILNIRHLSWNRRQDTSHLTQLQRSDVLLDGWIWRKNLSFFWASSFLPLREPYFPIFPQITLTSFASFMPQLWCSFMPFFLFVSDQRCWNWSEALHFSLTPVAVRWEFGKKLSSDCRSLCGLYENTGISKR